MKRTIRLTESELKNVISESVKTILKETSYDFARKAHKAAYDRAAKAPYDKAKWDQVGRLHKHLVSKTSERFDPNMPVVIVGGKLQGNYTAQEVLDNFDVTYIEEPSTNALFTDSPCIGYPHIKGYHGPMWDGDRIRYESPDAYDFFSR